MPDSTEPSQQIMEQDSAVEQTGQEINPEPVYTNPPISGFWRRLFAWLIDMFLLGIAGHTIAIVFFSFLFRIGPHGRPLGLLVIIPYFGFMNSRIAGGQTVGNRWLSIAVRNQDNQPIELWRALLRISILALPFLFNRWAIPIFQKPMIAWFSSLIIFGLGGAIFYTMVFNRKARQGIHDLLVGTYVVHLPGKPIQAFPTTSRIHLKHSADTPPLAAREEALSPFA
jgi:uncharacterized RDD family membrane protein YckC